MDTVIYTSYIVSLRIQCSTGYIEQWHQWHRPRLHIKELIDQKLLDIKYCSTDNMLSDFLTKPMINKKFIQQITRVMFKGNIDNMINYSNEVINRVIN